MIKKLLFILFILLSFGTKAQVENIIIVTTDGFRWQEVFKGMDSSIAVNPAFNQKESDQIFETYWDADVNKRREKLLPFVWNTIAAKGQIYGNRTLGNKVDNANPYWFSYPGYSEIFCGFVDTLINSNSYPANKNTNFLAFINQQTPYKEKVAAFGAWDAYDRILNEKRSQFPVICGTELCGGSNPDKEQQLINNMKQNSYKPFGEDEYLDMFTHYAAMDYITKKQPKVLYISYGETDEWAHHARYLDYLNAAHQVDKWLAELWNYIQNTPQYKNKTALFITVDHGRGDLKKEQWTSHNSKIADAHEIWFAIIAPSIPAKGEINTAMQLYQKQYAQTLCELLNLNFKCEHPVAEGFLNTLKK